MTLQESLHDLKFEKYILFIISYIASHCSFFKCHIWRLKGCKCYQVMRKSIPFLMSSISKTLISSQHAMIVSTGFDVEQQSQKIKKGHSGKMFYDTLNDASCLLVRLRDQIKLGLSIQIMLSSPSMTTRWHRYCRFYTCIPSSWPHLLTVDTSWDIIYLSDLS